MNDTCCLWAVIIFACVFGAPLLVCVVASAFVSSACAEQERQHWMEQ